MRQTQVKYEIPSQPRQVRFDSTTKCNAMCYSCHRFFSKRKGEMPLELITDLLNDISNWKKPLEEIVPVNYGEFFQRKDWFEILDATASSLPHTQIVIPTNGILLTPEKIEYLVKIPTIKIINFSLNAFFDETYEAFTGISSTELHKIESKMKQIKMERPDIDIRISMVFDPEYQTDYEKDMFLNYWSKWGSVWFLSASSAGRKQKHPYTPVILPCRSIFSDFVIGYDGKLSSCCFDSGFTLDLNFYSGDLLKDWTNEKLTKLRRIHNDHQREQIILCRECTFA